ncbi:CDP-glycerol glycerophosphotransferase family protein [Paenarthrobacter sp. Z7-10]|uniref:bifunctional glycosyltransferase/CDP-glycerol:glycerophosphate glycerophosphotransferase n=1 Tax=Paenarthrobacter sp. Z7-10 TaxID=2787635 RepID=UPI0022A9433E|nr:CDP-glycerol glycerophosphotransferase family protein [Paenarthrobacter sp. Z7-10]MCZ2403446.1 CDP-glycerol glycerophosphotransferase family protein [Paenarthrobacter sp. Z7-10]
MITRGSADSKTVLIKRLVDEVLAAAGSDDAALQTVIAEKCSALISRSARTEQLLWEPGERVFVRLAALARWNDIREFGRLGGLSRKAVATIPAGSGCFRDLPLRARLSPVIGDDAFLVPSTRLDHYAALNSLRWLTNGHLEIQGIAYIAGLPSDPGTLHQRLALIRSDGHQEHRPIRRLAIPSLGSTDLDPWTNYAEAGFSVVIDPKDLTAGSTDDSAPGILSTWNVALELTVGEHTRTVTLQDRTYANVMRTLLSERTQNNVYVSPEFSDEAGLSLVVRRAAIVVTDAQITGRQVRLSVRQAGSVARFTKVVATMGASRCEAPIVVKDDDGSQVQLSLPLLGAKDGLDFPQWTLQAVTEGGIRRAIGWDLSSSPTDGHIFGDDGYLVLSANAAGNLCALDSPCVTVVHSAESDQANGPLRFVVQTHNKGPALLFALVGSSVIPLDGVRAMGDGFFEISIRSIPRGQYKLERLGAPGRDIAVTRLSMGLGSAETLMSVKGQSLQLTARTRGGLTLKAGLRPAQANASNPRTLTGLVSVVVPMHNPDIYIEACLGSIQGQGYSNLEILVVDDGSTDGSIDFVARAAAVDPRIRIFPQEQTGSGSARNRAIASARGEFLTFVDADDLLADGALTTLVGMLNRTGSDLVVGGVQAFQGQKVDPSSWPEFLAHKPQTKRKLSTAPYVLANMSPSAHLFRTKYWRSKNLQFSADGAFESYVPLVTAYKSAVFDVVPDVVCRWRTWTQREKQNDTAALTNRASGMASKFSAVTASLAEHPAARKAFEEQFLRGVLIRATHVALSNGDPELRSVTSTQCKAVVGAIGEAAWYSGPVPERVHLELVAAGRYDLAARLLETDSPAWLAEKVTVSQGGLIRGIPFADEVQPVLSDRAAFTPFEALPARSMLTSLRWTEDGSRLLVEGAAYIEGLKADSDSLSISLELSGPNGYSSVLPAPRIREPRIDQFSADAVHSYEMAAFVSEIDFEVVLGHLAVPERAGYVAALDIRIRLEAPTVKRTVPFQEQRHFRILQTALARLHGDQLWVTPQFTKGSGVRVLLRRPALWATEAMIAGRTLTLKIAEYNKALSFDRIRLTLGAYSKTCALIDVGDGSKVAEIDVPQNALPDDPSGRRQWTVDAVTPNGATRRVGWSNSEVGVTISGSLGQNSLRVEATSQGNLTLLSDPLYTEVMDARIDQDANFLEFDVRTWTDGSLPVFHLGNDRVSRTDIDVVQLDDNRFTLRLAMATEDWGSIRRLLPLGRYNLRRIPDDPALAPYSSIVRTSTDFGRRTNRLDNEVVGIHIGATYGGNFRISLQPPRTLEEKTPVGQQRLYANYISHPKLPLDDNAFFFRCYFGEVANDSQVQIHNEVLSRVPSAKLYWEVSDFSVVLPDGGIPVIKRTEAWFRARSTARYTFSNNDADWWKLRRPGQTVVQTFHGHPFKRMGRSRWQSLGYGPERVDIRTEVKNSQWSHIVSQSPCATSLYVAEYGFTGEVLELGYPRNDVFHSSEAGEITRHTRELLGIPADKTVILYAPTWRESDQKSTTETVASDLFDAPRIAEALGDDYVLLMRGHRYSAKAGLGDRGAARIIDVTTYPDSADLCLASDIGIFDYSSMRFDYAVTRKPMIFYVPDLDLYKNERGWLFPYEDSAPGPLVYQEDVLAKTILSSTEWFPDFSAKYAEFAGSFAPREDGQAASRVVSQIVT